MSQDGKKTALYDRHVDLGARIIDFGGWQMPLQYKGGIIKEHKTVRDSVGLFDVSHMGEAWIRGRGAADAVQEIITNDAGKLQDGKALYTVMCYDDGGIVDDCIVYRKSDQEFLIILNASNRDKDVAWLREHASDVTVDDESDETALIAVQGPEARALVDGLSKDDLTEIGTFRFAYADVAGVRAMVARTGYTGEDGFELACASGDAVKLWDALLEAGGAPIGLGARDTLRLEARLCLYGNDIDETTNPYEASLGWVVKLDMADFIGKSTLQQVKADGPRRKLVGFVISERAIARPGYPIVDEHGAEIGRVTSGTRGISVDGSIGMGYVPADRAKAGETITIDCRGKRVAATLVKGPFYKR